MIENPGVAPIECFTTMGVSTTRFDKADGSIGQFGSGTKHAINVLLRNNISCVMFLSRTKLEFEVEGKVINDGLSSKDFNFVFVNETSSSGKKERHSTGFTLEWGTQDWTDPAMAIREFVSNEIGRASCRERV